MPKKKEKKRGEKKQDEGKKRQKHESSAAAADKPGSDDREKELYLTQVKYLNEELERCLLKCDELGRQNKDLTSQQSALEKEKKDITDFLKHSLLQKEEEVNELTEQLQGQRRAADRDRDALLQQHSQQTQQLQEQIDELTGEVAKLADRLESLTEFQRQRETLMSDMESLEKQLAKQKEEHRDDVHSLEMKALLEKRRMEKEMESRMAAMALQVQQQVDQKVPEVTRENMEVKARFNQLSQKAKGLMVQNAALQGSKSQLRVDLDILEQALSEMSRTSCTRKKVVEQLTEKCQELQAEQKVCRQQLEQLQTQHAGALAEAEELRQDRTLLSELCSSHRADLNRLEVELEEERRRRNRMKSSMQNAALTLRHALVSSTQQDSELAPWQQLMQMLLVDLNQHMVTDSTSECAPLTGLQTSEPAAARTLGADFQQAPHRPGEPGTLSRQYGRTNVLLQRRPSNQRTNLTKSTVLTSKPSKTKFK
ncbi:cilia- and flagella-associated protein 157 [Parambassis ranga]|uniref:Cilia- and flagella-associated protein 157 n=1 Tax=Parambassis ranga TaxID=210632 RepID=A0A6P7IZP5_9TELE|nr:cilia- and flagella-associated protein 157-like [Parambassis ranga]